MIEDRRDRNAAAGLCINESNAGTHGKATDGVCCRRCRLVHRFGSALGRRLYDTELRIGVRTYIQPRPILSGKARP